MQTWWIGIFAKGHRDWMREINGSEMANFEAAYVQKTTELDC